MENQASEQKSRKANLWLIAGGVLLVALLLGAAFVAGRLLKMPSGADEGAVTVVGEGGQMTMRKEFESPEGFPDRAPNVTGMMQKVENNSIFVEASNGPVTVLARQEGDQMNVDMQSEGDTTTVEIVVTRETQLYRNLVAFPMAQGGPSTDKIEPEIVPATLDELEGQVMVMAWGERKGDRLIAEAVLCTIFPRLDE
jgi:hypothetical protein